MMGCVSSCRRSRNEGQAGRQAAKRRHLSPEAACAETRRHLGRPCDLSSPFRSSLSQRQQQEGGIVWLGCLPPSHITTPSQQGGVLATVCLSVSRLTRNLPDAINLQCNTRIRATNYYTLVLHESVFIAKHTSFALSPQISPCCL